MCVMSCAKKPRVRLRTHFANNCVTDFFELGITLDDIIIILILTPFYGKVILLMLGFYLH